ncbi:MAG: phosphatase PAP2 family protein [Cyclobacteriaceae bacterium]
MYKYSQASFFFLSMICSFFIPLQIKAQQVYTIKPKKEIIIAGSGLAIGAFAWYQKKQIDGLSVDALMMLNPQDVNRLDRRAIGLSGSNGFGEISRVLAVVSPLLIFADKEAKTEWHAVGIMAAETFIINSALTGLVKNLTLRPRPFTYDPQIPLEKRMEADARFSFYSGHISTVASMTFFTAKVLNDLCQHRGVKIAAWSGASAITALTAINRVQSGEHFPTDVIAATLSGAGIGLLMPMLHKQKNSTQAQRFWVYPGGFAMHIPLNSSTKIVE